MLAGTSRVRITYQIADAVLQPVREPGGRNRGLLPPVRRTPAGGAGNVAIRRRPAGGHPAANRVDPLLYPGDWLDRVHHRPGIREVPPRPHRPVPRLPRPLPFRGLAVGRLGICLLYTSPSPRDRT